MESLTLLQRLLETVPARLESLSAVAEQPADGKWSPKQELGHLLDSAANNHQRIVRTQVEERPAMPGYDGDRWVELHRYQQRSWPELIDNWGALNRQLLAAAQAVPERDWTRTCTIAGSGPLTLKFVFEDYLRHMLHHLNHIGIQTDGL